MNVFQLFIKSTYSPRDIAKTRFQGIGKAILYVFLLSVLFAIPTAYYVSTGTVKSMNGFKTVLNKDFPDFTISNGKLQTDEKKATESQANGFVIVFDPTDSYGTEQIEAKQNAIGILQNKFVLAIDGQAQEMSYSMMPSELQKKDVIAGLNQNKAMIVTVLSALIFLVTAAGKFIEVSFLALIGLIIKNSQKKHLSYHQLWKLGYYFDEIVLNAEKLGVSQARRRYFIFASKTPVSSLNQINEFYSTNSRPISWAISDLVENVGDDIFNTASEHSLENKRRIEYLFENNLFELPNSERPDCHRLKPHSYKSVYGRMYWDRPAPTITRGFGSTGQGRFVHSLLKRTITPHEAARIQFFPDFFNFGDLRRRQYQDVIGNAVPSKLSYLLALHQLR